MDPNLTYNIYTGIIWDWRVATDLFAGGVGVGAFLFAFALWRFGGESQRKLAQTAAVIAPIAVSFGLLLLFWKLGNRLNAYQLGLNISPLSTMWWGAFIQGAFVGLAVVFAYRLLFPSSRLLAFLTPGLVGWAGAAFAIIVGVYHGFLLATVTSHPVWATGAMVMASVALFAATGPAAAVVFHMVRTIFGEGTDQTPTEFWRPSGFVLLLGTLAVGLALIAWWADLTFGSDRGRVALSALLDQYGTLLGVGGIVLGILVPLALLGLPLAMGKRSTGPAAIALSAALILVGGYSIRYAAVLGGQIPVPVATLANLN